MASLSNINGLFDVHSTGAILFSNTHGTSGQILRSNGNAAPTWVDASTVIGGPYLPLTGGTLSGPLSGTSATFTDNVSIGVYASADTGSLLLNGSTANRQSVLKCTNGNLHIDADSTYITYINYYTGSGGITFGNGAGAASGASVSSTGIVTATSLAGAGSAITALNASNLSSGTVPYGVTNKVLPTSGNYVWLAATLAGAYTVGVQTSFVRGADGWPNYGAVLHVGARGGGDAGGDYQIYCGHGSNYGGNHLRFRNADNDAAVSDTWTDWKTIWDSENLTSSTVPGGPYLPLTGNATSASTLTHNANRTDSTSYPVVWMTGSPTPAYSCAAVTITSSVGRINATTFNGALTGNATSATSATTSRYLSGAGGSSIQCTSGGTDYQYNYQVRENLGGSGNYSETYAPQLAFHWGGVVASSIMCETSGRIAIRNNPGTSYEAFAASNITATGAMYSPIYYDTNTAYYGDFASESRMATIRIGGSGYGLLSADNSRNLKFQGYSSTDGGFTGYGSTGVHLWQLYGAGTNYGFLSYNWGAWDLRKEKNGNLYLNNQSTYYLNPSGISIFNDARANIYYDQANPAYYTRPASSSYINTLQTAGQIQVGASGSSLLYIGGTSGNYFRFHTNNADTYFDMNCGNLYWRQGSSTRFYFYTTTANMTINGSLTQNSDIRVKENIVEISDCIGKIQAIRGVYYNRTDFNTDITKIGVIAQEVEEVLPELILEAPDTGLKSVAYAELTAVLINAIKEQQVIIDDLKLRIEKLEL
jgi:hypothetical protein